MPNSINVSINEAGAQCILSNFFEQEVVPLETARTFLWRQKDRIELSASRLSGLALRAVAYKERLIPHQENPDAVDELLRAARELIGLAGHNCQAGPGAYQREFDALNRAVGKAELQQEWIYGN